MSYSRWLDKGVGRVPCRSKAPLISVLLGTGTFPPWRTKLVREEQATGRGCHGEALWTPVGAVPLRALRPTLVVSMARDGRGRSHA
jgi:hypothetical protein